MLCAHSSTRLVAATPTSVSEQDMGSSNLRGRVAVITGASRGIGREIALKLAEAGVNIVVAAKSVTDTPNLPGTIYSVSKEVRLLGARALPVQVDVRDHEQVKAMVRSTLEEFGRLDILICNSGALWWKDVEHTPIEKFDLVHQVNSRGVFSAVLEALPIMKRQNFGRIVVMSPPVDLNWLPGHVAYCCSKYAQTMLAIGLAQELKGTGIAINALWPSTLIESFATKNFKMAERSQWRKASIIADAVLHMVQENPDELSGNALIAEEYLRTKGVADFAKYQCVPGIEPRKVWPPAKGKTWLAPTITHGVPPGIQSRL